MPGYCVRTATLVEPRITPCASLNFTEIREPAGLKLTVHFPFTKIANVGVSPPLTCVVMLLPAAARQTLVAGLV